MNKTLQDVANKCLNAFHLRIHIHNTLLNTRTEQRFLSNARKKNVKHVLERNYYKSRCKEMIGGTTARNKRFLTAFFRRTRSDCYYFCSYTDPISCMRTAVVQLERVDRNFGTRCRHERYRVANRFFNLQRIIAAPNS